MTKLKKLMQVCESATPGPWKYHAHKDNVSGVIGRDYYEACENGGPHRQWTTYSGKEDSEHIATFNPALVSLMLAEIMAGRENIESLSKCATNGQKIIEGLEFSLKYEHARAALDKALEEL